jgi:xanthine dehydrogenase YagS FAD-binding subunit
MTDTNVKKRYPALQQAILLAASPQLRNFGTIGGNLVQATRCWYYRGPFNCWLKGGDFCYARNGENSHHAIFGAGACNSVQPSDPAVALVALAADVSIAGPQSKQTMPLERFFQLPGLQSRQLTVLKPGEIILKIIVPAPDPDSRGVFFKAMNRKIWAFALASIAAQVTFDGDIVKDVRLVLGGVAAIPWRVPDAESFLRGKSLNDKNIRDTSELAVAGAKPLAQNGYKIALVKGIVANALDTIKAGSV